MNVLEVGCGPSTFASYLAEGIAPGVVTGLDLDAEFVDRARQKCADYGIRNVAFVVGDAYQLPFGDGEFDAVVSYTGIGVLRDPETAVQEMLRVCRKGGTISVAEVVTGRLGIQFSGIDSVQGEEAFPGAKRYHEVLDTIKDKLTGWTIPGIGSDGWPPSALMGLLGQVGLKRIRFNAWGYGLAPDDARVSQERRFELREEEFKAQKEWLASLRDSNYDLAIDEEDIEEFGQLVDARYEWIRNHSAYDWEAGVSIVMSGIKAIDENQRPAVAP